jgi:EAL and modified HD-GYP domain-containing signal transduction protein
MSVRSVSATAFVARQPIFDCAKRSFGYELLCRYKPESEGDTSDATTSMLDVLASGLLPTGLDELMGGKQAFISCTREFQAEDVAVLPSERVILEIHESIKPDEELLNTCRKLKAAGYRLALDDFAMAESGRPFLDLADIVKVVETRRTMRSPATQEALRKLKQYVAKRVEMLAYTSFWAQGFDIGSGLTEAFCEMLTARLKGSGMRWDRPHAEALMALAVRWNRAGCGTPTGCSSGGRPRRTTICGRARRDPALLDLPDFV